jgi:phosphinothricin acetyltransferase
MSVTSQIIIPAAASHIPAMLDIYRPFVEHTAVSFETELPSVEEFEKRLHKIQAEAPWLVCLADDKVAGYAYASGHRERAAYRWNREVSVYVHPDFRRKKIAHALYAELFRIIRLQGFTNALAGIALPNEASVGFHESFGFVKSAEFHRVGYKMGRWHDVGWWEMPLGQNHPPGEIRHDWRALMPEIKP